MNKKFLVLLLTLCLAVCVFTLGVGAEDGSAATGVFGTNMDTFTFVSLVVAGVLVIAAIIICIIKREAVVKGLKAYKSEMKKITWYSRKNVVRGTIFVIVSVIVIALVVGLLDIVFFEAQYLLTGSGFSFINKLK